MTIMADDLISRKAEIEWINKMFCEPCKEKRNTYGGVVCRSCLIDDAIGAIETAPSAQPESEEFEWCTDCKEYDQTAHCCHRWTKVIRKTVAELKQSQWIPCSERLPKHDETVLVWYCNEIRIGYLETGFSENGVWVLHGGFPFKHDEKKVIAWMPLPKPYEAEE